MTLVLPGLRPAGRRQPQGRPDRDADLVRAASPARCSPSLVGLRLARLRLLARHRHRSLLGLLRLVLMAARRRLGRPVRRRLAARPAADPRACQHRRAVVGVNGAAQPHGRRDPALRRAPGRRAARLHHHHVRRRRRVRRPRTAATTCCCSAATPAPAAGGCGRTRMTVASIDAEHRPDRADRPAAQHGELPVRRGLGDGRAVPRRVRLRGLLPQRRQHLGAATTPSCSATSENPGVDATISAVEGITGLEDQLLGDGQPPGLQGPRRRRRRRHPQRPRRRSRSAASAATSPATSSPASASSTATTRSGSPAPARAPTTTRGWPARSA